MLLEQSIINYKCGSRGRVSAIISAIFLLIIVLYFQYEIDRIPKIALIGIVISCALNRYFFLIPFVHQNFSYPFRISWDTLSILRTSFLYKNIISYTTTAIVFACVIVTVIADLEWAILTGVAIEAFRYENENEIEKEKENEKENENESGNNFQSRSHVF